MKTHSTLFALLISLLFSVSAFGQNLVPNPGFESYSSCGDSVSPFPGSSVISPWYSPSYATPDYFQPDCPFGTICIGLGTPCNILGYAVPHSGDAYAGFITYEDFPLGCPGILQTGWREYHQVQLIEPLQPGVEYCVSFYVTLADNVRYATNNIGAYLSSSPINTTGNGNLGVTPQVISTGVISDTTSWTQITGNLVATGGEQYLIIGGFNTSPAPNNCAALFPYAYYFLDDVSVTSVCESYNENATAEICAGDSIFLAGAWQSTAGTYVDVLFSTSCCDSTITTTLGISGSSTTEVDESICVGDSIFLGGDWQNSSGVYTDILSGSGDCSDIIITTLTVGDTGSPELLCPPDISVSCFSELPPGYQYITDFLAAGGTADDDCGLQLQSFKLFTQISDGNSCPETITRSYQVGDLAGNVSNCVQQILINDEEAPIVNCPANITIPLSPGETGVYIEYVDANASDNCIDVSAVLSSGLGSGSTFPPGVNTEIWTATDDCGNTSSCSFVITVTGGSVPCLPPTDLITIILSPTNARVEWAPVGGAIRYHLKGRPVGSPGFAHSYPVNAFKNVGGLNPGQNYEWQVRVMCADSSISAFSGFDYFTMPAPGKYAGENDLQFDLFPNPATSSVFLQLQSAIDQEGRITVYNILGARIYEMDATLTSGINSFQIETSQYSKGLYYIEFKGTSGLLSKELIIEN